VNRELAVLKNLFNRCREWKLYEGDNPVATVEQTKEPKQRLRVLLPEEETRLLTECEEPLRAMVLIGLYCGVRLKSEGAHSSMARHRFPTQDTHRPGGLFEKLKTQDDPDELPRP
jgi:integrase